MSEKKRDQCKNILALFVIGEFKDEKKSNLKDFVVDKYYAVYLNENEDSQTNNKDIELPEDSTIEDDAELFMMYKDAIENQQKKIFKIEKKENQSTITMIIKKIGKKDRTMKGIYKIDEGTIEYIDNDFSKVTKENDIIGIINDCFSSNEIELINPKQYDNKLEELDKKLKSLEQPAAAAKEKLETIQNNRRISENEIKEKWKEVEKFDKIAKEKGKQAKEIEEEIKKQEKIIEKQEEIIKKEKTRESAKKQTTNNSKLEKLEQEKTKSKSDLQLLKSKSEGNISNDDNSNKMLQSKSATSIKANPKCGDVDKLEISDKEKNEIIEIVKSKISFYIDETKNKENKKILKDMKDEDVGDIYEFIKKYLDFIMKIRVGKYEPMRNRNRKFENTKRGYDIYTIFSEIAKEEVRKMEIIRGNTEVNIKYVWSGDIFNHTSYFPTKKEAKNKIVHPFMKSLKKRVINNIIKQKNIKFDFVNKNIRDEFEELLIDKIKCEIERLTSENLYQRGENHYFYQEAGFESSTRGQGHGGNKKTRKMKSRNNKKRSTMRKFYNYFF